MKAENQKPPFQVSRSAELWLSRRIREWRESEEGHDGKRQSAGIAVRPSEARSMAALLPSDHSEFTTKEYWNKFFVNRNKSAFEWYGTSADVLPTLLPFVRQADSILMVGCGNSNFSSDLYDQGYRNIVNLDFSEVVIAEMREKNAAREGMTWEVGDMTNMEAHQPEAHSVVVDKGALDALLSADTAELKEQAVRMFSEIDRVLAKDGKYICISLAESFLLSTLLTYFTATSASSWGIEVWPITTATRSPFMPLMFVISRSSQPSLAVHVTATGQKASPALALNVSQTISHIASLQQYQSMSFRIGTLEMGRFEVLHLYAPDSTDVTISAVPRFTIYIVDVCEKAQQSCVVFLVPIGRESEYQFTSKNGLVDLAFQAKTKRLIAVCCNRPHSFPESAALQAELSPIMMSLKPASMPATESIPYLGVGKDEAWELLEEGRSSMSGGYLVEERDHEATGGVVRRLIFLQNQQLVQTEVRLLRSKKAASKGKSSSGSKKGGKSASAKKSEPDSGLAFDYQYIDDHHRGMLSALALAPSLSLQGSQSTGGETRRSALVIGLGGGALVMCMQRLLPQLAVTVCEIDEEVRGVAEKYFAFQPRKQTQVVIADGLQLVSQHHAGQPRSVFDLVVLDVDSKDLSSGLSAPPAAFVEDSFLQQLYDLLAEDGLLIINAAARSNQALQGILDSLVRTFGHSSHVYLLQPSKETVNVEIICLKRRIVEEVTGKKGSVSRPQVQWQRTLDAWLKVRLARNRTEGKSKPACYDAQQPLFCFRTAFAHWCVCAVCVCGRIAARRTFWS